MSHPGRWNLNSSPKPPQRKLRKIFSIWYATLASNRKRENISGHYINCPSWELIYPTLTNRYISNPLLFHMYQYIYASGPIYPIQADFDQYRPVRANTTSLELIQTSSKPIFSYYHWNILLINWYKPTPGHLDILVYLFLFHTTSPWFIFVRLGSSIFIQISHLVLTWYLRIWLWYF